MRRTSYNRRDEDNGTIDVVVNVSGGKSKNENNVTFAAIHYYLAKVMYVCARAA